jgi:hypothetical protein
MNIFKALFKPRQKREGVLLRYTNEGFFIELKQMSTYIKWSDISKVTAYKLDLLAIDQVCLDVETTDITYKLNEEQTGWMELVIAMNKALDLADDWYVQIIQPPFERNETILYSKESAAIS